MLLPAGADLLFGELNSAYPALANEADSGDPKAKAMAANSLLDRGFGKPAQILQVGSEMSLDVNVRPRRSLHRELRQWQIG